MSAVESHQHPGHDAGHHGHRHYLEHAHGGELHGHGDEHGHGSFQSYMVGFALSVVLTVIPFWLVMSGVLSASATAALIIAAAIAQILVHTVCFLHVNTRGEGGWTLMAYVFTAVLVLITIGGSVWIMYHLNTNMMPSMPTGDHRPDPALNGRGGKRAALLALALVATGVCLALAVWQLERRAWKLALIEQVDRRIHGPAGFLPPPRAWARWTAQDPAYSKVEVTGVFAHDRETLVQAVTERGPGFWVMTPLRTSDATILVNRGFVPPERADRATRAGGQSAGPVTIVGLVRLSEPGGGFLRANDPAHDRWYSRDVAAIARARGLGPVAPFFIDAGGRGNPGGYPVGGLTVVSFRNAHLVYALTWLALAGIAGFAAIRLWRSDREPR